MSVGPVVLPANQPPRFYRGGAAIAALRGEPAASEYVPEDWVASCTTLHGEPISGLSPLPDGTLLRDAVAADPAGWLGDRHVARFGADPALLVKLLDAGQRLPVHCHPSDSFAGAHFGSRYGKTEAWVVIGAEPGATVHIGFAEDTDADTVAAWVTRQDSATMLAALNEVPISAGDTVFVPAGLPHAIGAGVFIVELQQPTDLSVTLEWQGFVDDERAGHLGIGFETALGCVDRAGWAGRLDTIVRRGAGDALFDGGAEPFFRAVRVHAGAELAPSFGVLVVTGGAGTLRTERGDAVPVVRGSTVAIPHAAGAITLDGDATAVHCRPPAP